MRSINQSDEVYCPECGFMGFKNYHDMSECPYARVKLLRDTPRDCIDHGVGYEGIHGLGCNCPEPRDCIEARRCRCDPVARNEGFYSLDCVKHRIDYARRATEFDREMARYRAAQLTEVTPETEYRYREVKFLGTRGGYTEVKPKHPDLDYVD